MAGLANRFRDSNNPLPFVFYSLNYPASATVPDYFNSLATGRNTLVYELNWLAEQCGTRLPAIVLAGHSQGGAVIQEALVNWDSAPNLTAKARLAIMAVASFGDPNFSPGQPFDAPASASTGGRMGTRLQVYSDQLTAFRYWGWPPDTSGEGWVYKVRSWCFSTDYWCATGNSEAIHNAYDLNFDAAQSWIQYMLNGF